MCAGVTANEVVDVLHGFGIDDQAASDLGIAVLKIAAVWYSHSSTPEHRTLRPQPTLNRQPSWLDLDTTMCHVTYPVRTVALLTA